VTLFTVICRLLFEAFTRKGSYMAVRVNQICFGVTAKDHRHFVSVANGFLNTSSKRNAISGVIATPTI